MQKLIRNKHGAAVAYVMLALIVVFIMVSVVASIAQANIKQAGYQENSLMAYYIARSGAELAYEAIMTTTPSLLDTFKNNSAYTLTENNIDFEKGTADVKVTSSGTGESQKIIIESTGTLKSKPVSRTVTLEFYIDYSNKPDMYWSK